MPSPKNVKKPKISVIVVNKTVDAIAGSTPVLSKINGIKIPDKHAITKLSIIAAAITKPNSGISNQYEAIVPIIAANIKPLMAPTTNSFPMTRNAFALVISLKANALTATVNVCVPAFPPIDATIGINIARATTCFKDDSKMAMTNDAAMAVNKFMSNQVNLDFIVCNTAL